MFLQLLVEGQDGCGIVGHSMVRPGCEVELSHFQTPIRAALQLYRWCGGSVCVYTHGEPSIAKIHTQHTHTHTHTEPPTHLH